MAEASSSVEESRQSSNENGSLRRPTNRLRELFPKYRFPRDFEEYELSEPLESLTFSQVVDVLDDIQQWWNRVCVVWISETAFLIFKMDYRPKLPRKAYKGPQMEIEIYPREYSIHSLSKWFAIYEESPQKADSCLTTLMSLDDDKYNILTILGGCRKSWRYNAPVPPIVDCPLHPTTISAILTQPHRKAGAFENMKFSALQCQAFANSIPKDWNFTLKKCQFSDGGISFVNTLIEKEEDGLTVFHATDILPLDHVQLHRLLQVDCIRKLVLGDIDFDPNLSRTLGDSVSNLDVFSLNNCSLADGGWALSDALKAGQGPTNEFHLSCYMPRTTGLPFNTPENWSRFLFSLANIPTTKLHLNFKALPSGSGQLCSVFVEALVKNVHVREVTVFSVSENLSDQTKRDHANSLARVMEENRVLEKVDVSFGGDLFVKEIWKKDIEPRLEANRINRYRKLFNELAKSKSGGAVVGTALNRVRHDSSLLFMILTQNSEEIGRNASGVTISTSKKRIANAAELQQDDGKTPKKESRTTG